MLGSGSLKRIRVGVGPDPEASALIVETANGSDVLLRV